MRYYIEATARALMALVIVVGACLMCALATSCAKVDNLVDYSKTLLVDCGKPAIVKASNEIGPLVETLLVESINGEGEISWSPIKDAAGRWTAELGGCVLADVIARAMAPESTDPRAPKSSTLTPLQLHRADLMQGFQQLKSEKWGGITFQLPGGRKL